MNRDLEAKETWKLLGFYRILWHLHPSQWDALLICRRLHFSDIRDTINIPVNRA